MARRAAAAAATIPRKYIYKLLHFFAIVLSVSFRFSPPSADSHMLSAPNTDEIVIGHSYTQHIPVHMTDSLDTDMMGMYDFQYPAPPVVDPQLLGLFDGDHSEFAHAAMVNSGFIADEKTPMADANAAKEEEFMEQFFDTEAFEQSMTPVEHAR